MAIPKHSIGLSMYLNKSVNLFYNGEDNAEFLQGNKDFTIAVALHKKADDDKIDVSGQEWKAYVYNVSSETLEEVNVTVGADFLTVDNSTNLITERSGLNYLYVKAVTDEDYSWESKFYVHKNNAYKMKTTPNGGTTPTARGVNLADVKNLLKLATDPLASKDLNNIQNQAFLTKGVSSGLADNRLSNVKADDLRSAIETMFAKKGLENVKATDILYQLGLSKGTDGQVAVKSGDKLAFKDLPSTDIKKNIEYLEINTPQPINMVDVDMLFLTLQGYEGVEFNQTLPDITTVKDGTFIFVRMFTSNNPGEHKVNDFKLTAFGDQTIAGGRELIVPDVQDRSFILIADSTDRDWHEFMNFENLEVPGNTVSMLNSDDVDIVYNTESIEAIYPLKVSQQNVVLNKVGGRSQLEIDPFYFTRYNPDGYYASLKYQTEIIEKNNKNIFQDGKLWFDDVVVGSKGFIQLDSINKSIGIQEDDNKDPNITKGTPTLVVARISMFGNASNDGTVELVLKNLDGTAYLNSKGQPFGVKKDYKQGEALGNLVCADILMETGVKPFVVHVEHDFVDDSLVLNDRVNGNSCIMVQYIHEEAKTGEALQQFMLDTKDDIIFGSKYYGENLKSLNQAVSVDYAEQVVNANTGMTSNNGVHLSNSTKMKVGIANHVLHLGTDNSDDLTYFNVGYIFNGEDATNLIGSKLKATITLTNKDNAFNVALAKWTGAKDQYTNKIITDVTEQGPVLETNWTLQQVKFISEDAVNENHVESFDFTVPNGANNFAVIMYPITKQAPTNLELSQFKIDSYIQGSVHSLKYNELGIGLTKKDAVK